jgi:LmbE family N-acetylglucosaminyl deacetylase
MLDSKKVLVVVAHPDDEVLGCAGYLLEAKHRGINTHVLYLNNGCNFRKDFNSKEIACQVHNVSKILGFKPHIENFKTGMFDTYARNEIASVIDSYVKRIKPDTVITHISNDLHQDHRIVNEATFIACRFKSNSSVRNIMEMPVISSSEINPNFDFKPTLFVDVTNHIKEKIKAMEEYIFEVEAFKELRGESGIEGWGRFYGMHIGVQYAEAFKLIRGCL